MIDGKKTSGSTVKHFFTSMKVAVFFLFFLAFISIIGTIIPQKQELFVYENIYSPFFSKLITAAGFDNLYNSFIFKLLIFLIGLNIVICSFEHFRKKIRSKETIILPFKAYEGERFCAFEIISDGTEKIKKYFKNKGFSLKEAKDEDSRLHLYYEKGFVKTWGSLITHMSILIIFIGFVYSGIAGFNDMAFLMEGLDDKDIYSAGNGTFKVKLKEFRLELDENHRIKDYYSDIDVLEGDKKIFGKTIEVNNPLEYKGYTFYQTNWGVLGMDISVLSPSGKSIAEIPLDDAGEPADMYNFIKISDTEIVKVGEFYPDAGGDKNNPENISNFTGNPAVSLYMADDFMEKHRKRLKPSWKLLGWLYEKEKNTIKYKEYKFCYDKTLEYSVLKVKKDPGVPIVFAGCFFIMIGLFLTFYINHIIIRICLVKTSDDKTIVYLGYAGRENQGHYMENIKNELLRGEK